MRVKVEESCKEENIGNRNDDDGGGALETFCKPQETVCAMRL